MSTNKDRVDYTRTQPYILGKKYKELGEMLMDKRTDMRDLADLAHGLGVQVSISLGEDDPVEYSPKTGKG